MATTDATWGDIVTLALGTSGACAGDEPPSPEDMAAAAAIGNGMLGAWSMDGLYVWNVDISVFALTSGQQSYNVGPTAPAPFNITRPSRIKNANLVYSTQNPPTRVPLIIYDDDGWMDIPVRGISGTPIGVYYSPNYPNGVLNAYPIPTAGFSVELEIWTAIPQFASLLDVISFPPGYYEAIYLNLAVRLQTPKWGIEQTSPSLMALANQSRARIQGLNMAPSPNMKIDPGMQSSRNDASGYRNVYNPAPVWTR